MYLVTDLKKISNYTSLTKMCPNKYETCHIKTHLRPRRHSARRRRRRAPAAQSAAA